MFCDLGTISCDRAKVAEILSSNDIEFHNHNNYLWELDVPETVGSPFIATVSEAIHYLFNEYTNINSLLLVVKPDEYYPTEL